MKTMIGALLLVTVAAAWAQAPSFQYAASTRQLMLDIIVPASDVVFRYPGGGDSPEGDEDWSKVRSSSLVVAESANLLMLPGRAKDKRDWMIYAKALGDAGAAAFKAAERKDADALAAASDKLVETCETCHKKYLKP